MTMTKLDFVAIHSPDSERSRRFYADTLGLRADEHTQFELWAGETCLGIWEPARFGNEFRLRKNAHFALHVDDAADARAELGPRASNSSVRYLIPVSATWRSSRIRTETILAAPSLRDLRSRRRGQSRSPPDKTVRGEAAAAASLGRRRPDSPAAATHTSSSRRRAGRFWAGWPGRRVGGERAPLV